MHVLFSFGFLLRSRTPLGNVQDRAEVMIYYDSCIVFLFDTKFHINLLQYVAYYEAFCC